VLLVGGASRRFGAPKALARAGGETLAERGWRLLGEACDERLAVGKAGELELPFPIVDDGTPVRVPAAGVLAGLRAASHPTVVFLPVDCPLATPALLRLLGRECRDAAFPAGEPLPGAWSTTALPLLERRFAAGAYGLRDAAAELDVARVEVDPALVADADTPDDLRRLLAPGPATGARAARARSRPAPA
jgi:molybdopterin-guanine dinucleotide biosynthesis protein A